MRSVSRRHILGRGWKKDVRRQSAFSTRELFGGCKTHDAPVISTEGMARGQPSDSVEGWVAGSSLRDFDIALILLHPSPSQGIYKAFIPRPSNPQATCP